MIGFGTSDKPRRASAQQLASHVEDVARAIDAIGVECFIAVGQDWGGPIACGVGSRYASRVAGLVLGNTAVLPPMRPFRSKAFHKLSLRTARRYRSPITAARIAWKE